MEKTQADAVAQAILEPNLRAQEELRNKRAVERAVESAQLARKRRVARLTLAGAGIGAAVAYFSGVHFSIGVIWGGLAGSAVGWLITRRAAV